MPRDKGPAIVAGMPERIVVPGIYEVRTKEFVQGSAMILVMMEMSRQETAGWVMGTLYAHAKRGGTVVDAEIGIELPIYEEVEGWHPDHFDLEEAIYGADLSRAFGTNAKRFAFTPPMRMPQRRSVRRWQYFYAAFALSGILSMPIEDVEKAKRLGLA